MSLEVCFNSNTTTSWYIGIDYDKQVGIFRTIYL